jgi:hypothetical protein
MSEPMPATDWFYAVRGNKIGPVSDAQIKGLLSKGELGADVYVWRKGLKDWIPIRESELSEPINDVPPPLTASLIGNTWVWVIAFLPLVFAVIDAAIIQMKIENLVASGWWNALEFSNQGGLLTVGPKQPSGLPWGLPPAFYALFGLLDERRLKKAGHSSKYMPLLAVLLVPVYLFTRAKRLRQFPYYGIVWAVCFVFELIAAQT